MALVTVKVDVKENEPEPEQQLDSGEHIIKRLVPVKGECLCVRVKSKLMTSVDLLNTLKGQFYWYLSMPHADYQQQSTTRKGVCLQQRAQAD